ncbi:hypothetical protein U1Q18_040670, partial [Sarracenia purpurea var. burkii]
MVVKKTFQVDVSNNPFASLHDSTDTDEQSTHPLPVAEVAALDPEPENPNSGDSPSASNSENDQHVHSTTTAQTPIQAHFQQPNKKTSSSKKKNR